MAIKPIKENTSQSSRINHLIGLLIFVILFYYLLIIFTHRFWLPLAAEFLVLENQPRQADLIVVATPFRPRFIHALNLLQKGYAGQILLVGDARIIMPWSGKTSIELAQKEAVKRGIPVSKIHVKHSTGTRADALQAKSLMTSLGLKSALIVSDPYNMRRLAMVFNHVFINSGLELTFLPTNLKRVSPDYWWLSPDSFIYVIKEWIKLPMNYYLLNSQTITKVEPPRKNNTEESAGNFTAPVFDMEYLFSKKNLLMNLSRLFMYKIGAFLVVDESRMNMDTVITPVLSPQVLFCYKKSICKNIFLLNGASDYTQKSMGEEKFQTEINKKAIMLGINPDDLNIVPYITKDAYQTTLFLNRFMSENNLKSASIYLPYYETKKFKFYFNRFLNPDFTIQIIPQETSYRHLLEQWLQNTGIGNLYLDQYLIMSHYYFNKFLWS
jgi:uncharacterized SAM-binding protein YcdF (DUF218 family)